MSVQAGSRLGPYEIVAPIGAGGMGEVWRAKDTRLDRQIAIKLLPQHLSGDPAFRLRFEREARLISSLNHPNICTLHDVGEKDGQDYLVMEFCDGESLADRLLRGPMPVEQVLRAAMEIAAALDRAHRAGIIHRDLKPGNVVLTKGGAKLLDFGLAKPATIVGMGIHPAAPLLSIATEHKPLTQEGAIVGTFQYMAPEQLEGRDADARTDIFAFGAMLYEMLTGKRAFEGKTKASLIASILDRQPEPIALVRPLTPPALERVVRTALEKDPEDRWQTAHDLLLQLRWIADAGSQAEVARPVVARRRIRERVAWSLAAVALVAATLTGLALYRKGTKAVASLHAELGAPPAALVSFSEEYAAALKISPDGRHVVFAAVAEDKIPRLWVRPLDSDAARPLPGTDRAFCPFWSPDSDFVAFFSDNKLKKVDLAGGPPLTICETVMNPRSGSWNRNGDILFAPGSLSPIHRVSAAGGKSVPVTQLDGAGGETTHRWVTFLPDQKTFLYLAGAHSAATQSEKHAVYAGSLDGKLRKLILHARSNVEYAAGHLLWVRDGSLVAQRFDAKKLSLEGQPAVIASGVRYSTGFFVGTFSVSGDGTLVYAGAGNNRWPLAWFDRSGKKIADAAGAENWWQVSLSPDGSRFVAAIPDESIGTPDLWLYDVGSGTRSRLTDSPRGDDNAIWSPDGTKIVYARSRETNNWTHLYVRDVEAGQEEELLVASDSTKLPMSWSPDGRHVAFSSLVDGSRSDILLVAMDGTKKVTPLLATAAGETSFQFSPDGRWAVYTQNEATKSPQVYVTALPAARARWQIGAGNAVFGLFSRGGRELLYVTSTGEFYAVDISADSTTFRPGPPRLLARWPALLSTIGDITRDGERILLMDRPPDADSATIHMVTNWTAAMERRGR